MEFDRAPLNFAPIRAFEEPGWSRCSEDLSRSEHVNTSHPLRGEFGPVRDGKLGGPETEAMAAPAVDVQLRSTWSSLRAR